MFQKRIGFRRINDQDTLYSGVLSWIKNEHLKLFRILWYRCSGHFVICACGLLSLGTLNLGICRNGNEYPPLKYCTHVTGSFYGNIPFYNRWHPYNKTNTLFSIVIWFIWIRIKWTLQVNVHISKLLDNYFVVNNNISYLQDITRN